MKPDARHLAGLTLAREALKPITDPDTSETGPMVAATLDLLVADAGHGDDIAVTVLLPRDLWGRACRHTRAAPAWLAPNATAGDHVAQVLRALLADHLKDVP